MLLPAETLLWLEHSALLIATVILAYIGILNGSWVQDDLEGVAAYDGTFKHLGAVTPQPGAQKADSYLPGSGSLWNDVLTWLRWQIGKQIHPSANKPLDPAKPKDKKHPSYAPDQRKHHRLNIILACGVGPLLYTLLSRVLDPQVAFLATLLMLVHPVGVQCIGWISGIGYVLAAFFMLLGLNLAVQVGPIPLGSYALISWETARTLGALGLYAVLQFLAFRS